MRNSISLLPVSGSFLPLPSEEWMQASGFMPLSGKITEKGDYVTLSPMTVGPVPNDSRLFGSERNGDHPQHRLFFRRKCHYVRARLIRHGLLDAVLVGGTDALCRFTLNGFNSLMILDKEHCRPFDRTRAGLNLGEGAGYLVLQSDKSLTKAPYCELSGYANANEAYHQTGSSPDGDGPFLSMSQAIASAGLTAGAIDYINVHGTGTPSNDASEGKAIRRIFDTRIPPFSSVKAFIGHTLGASEGIEAVYSVLSIRHGLIYPNLNFHLSDEESGLIPETVFRSGLPIRHVLSNSFGFGGNNSSLVFSTLTQ